MNPWEGIPEADIDLLTRIVIGEAEGSGALGQQAVASVIGNRMMSRGQTAEEVITAPSQFEPWGNEAKRNQLMAIQPNDPRYQTVRNNIAPILTGQAPDPTGGATHFYSPGVMAQRGQGSPRWAQGVPSQDIGGNRFLQLDPPPERGPAGAPTAAPVPMERPNFDGPPVAQRSLAGFVQQQQAAQANPANWVELGNQGAVRNLPIADALRTNLERSVETVYGPGFRARVYSGGQPERGSGGRRVGSTRHDGGLAADVHVYGPDGQRVTGDGLAPLARHWLSQGYGGVGLEMRGGGIHLDVHQNRAPFWAYRPLTPGQQAAVQEGLAARRGQQPETMMAFNPVPQPRPANAGAAAIEAATGAQPPAIERASVPTPPSVVASAPASGPTTPRPDTFTGGSNMTDMAAEKPAPASVGGLGGLGGFQPMAGGKFGEMLQMIGMALLSSPGNAPLQNLPAMAFAMQDRRQRTEDRDFDRRRQSTLDEAALDDRRSSTEMRRLQMEQMRRAAEREQQDALILSGRAPSVAGAAPASPDVLAPAPMPQAAPAPGAQAAPPSPPASPIAAPAAAPVAQEPPSSPTDMQIQRLDRAMSDPRLSPQARQQLVEQKNKLLSNFTFQTRPDGSVLRIDKTDNSVREIRPAPQRLSDSDRGRVVEADDAVSTARSSLGAIDRAIQLNRESFSGALADTRAGIVANLPSWAPGRQTAVNTLELQNTMMRQVLSSLKSTFGAAPTEGERRILADVEGSVNAPVEIREAVLRRARAAAESAIARQSARSRGIRDGSYYRQPPEAAAEPPAAAPQATTAQPAQPAADPYAAARDAIRRGAPAEAVRERLRQNGLDPSRL